MERFSTSTLRFSTGPDADRMSEIWRAKQLEYSWTLTLAGRYVDFWTLTGRALDFALARVPSIDKALKPSLPEAYFELDVFPDARAALGWDIMGAVSFGFGALWLNRGKMPDEHADHSAARTIGD
jgi:FMN phosphatase YigB (HAD superfamily)